VQDFHRYDIASDKALRLAAHCGGHYSSTDHVVSKITCRGPVGDGVIAVDGSAALLSASPAYNLTLLAQKVPVQPLVDLARRMKKNIPSGIVATGKLDADLTVQRDTNRGGPIWEGGGAVVALNMRSPVNNTRLSLERVPFAVSSHSDSALSVTAKRENRRILAFVAHVGVGPLLDWAGGLRDCAWPVFACWIFLAVDGMPKCNGYLISLELPVCPPPRWQPTGRLTSASAWAVTGLTLLLRQ
jgi:hypothetical protein